MCESEIELYFTKRVKETGNWARKFTSPATGGVPDQVACISGHTLFVEFKAPGKKLRPMQEREHERMKAAGCIVLVIDSLKAIDDLLEIR
jgi:hypothetical protein